MRELCRLQTIPDDFVVQGDLASVQKQVGNAVPSALAERVALELRTRFFGDTECKKKSSLVPAARDDCPPPKPVAPVPEKWQDLAHSDTAHPGTGRGRRASRATTG
jgi:DNA (cytosine-5)-methyltransferase 1